jgi:GNAT superfamily N-acetyltransferase
MNNENPVITTGTSIADNIKLLEDRLYEHNSQATGQDDGQLFSFLIHDTRREIIAGIAGWTWAGACEIRELWVHPSFRGKGHGRKLLAAAENEAQARGCKVILLSSYSFQAPEFYEKCGYTLAWKLEGFPPGYDYCHFVKQFMPTA